MQAFHDAWFEALKIMIDTPDQAEQAIIDWGHPDWTFVEKPGDLKAALEHLAQATLGANQIAFQRPQLLVSRLGEAQAVWARAGQAPPQADLNQLVDGRFALGSARDTALSRTQPPVNSSFLLTAQGRAAAALGRGAAERAAGGQAAAGEDRLRAGEHAPDRARRSDDLTAQVLPVLRSSQLYLKIEGSAAWPGPEGRFIAGRYSLVRQGARLQRAAVPGRSRGSTRTG